MRRNERRQTKRQKHIGIILQAAERADAPEWVTDNLALIRQSAARVRKTGAGRSDPVFAAELDDCLASCGRKPTEEGIAAFFAEKSAAGRVYDVKSLSAVPDGLAFRAIRTIADVCAGSRPASLLPGAVELLRMLPELDLSPLFYAAWTPEKRLLEADPSFGSSTPATRAACRSAVARYAKKHGVSEERACEALLSEARTKGIPVSGLLLARNGSRGALAVWIASLVLLTGGALTLCGFLFGRLAFLLALPLAEGFAPLCDRLASVFDRTPPAPRLLPFDSVPPEGKTVVAVTTILKKDPVPELEKLERFCFQNPDPAFSFCLLADLPEAGRPRVREDAPLLDRLKKELERLNSLHGERFFAFWRDREPAESDRFRGKERKRGAVGALLKRLRGEQTGNVIGRVPENVRFLLTLDADTELSPGFVSDLLAVALHPANREVGVFQPAVQTGLTSSYRTYFTRLTAGSAGATGYERALFDRSMSLFGEGVFCGKGLLAVDRFAEKALSLPEGKILSHDLPEGGLAYTLAVPDLVLRDSVPETPLSWNRRAHRWIRGDVQNLILLTDRRLSFAAKKQIVCNLLRHLTPWFSLRAILAGALFLREELPAFLLALFAVSHLLIPCASGLLHGLFSRNTLRFRHALTRGLPAAAEWLFRLCWELVSLCRNAWLTLDAFSRSFWRMLFSKKRLLEWTTAAEGERDPGSVVSHIRDGLPSAAVGTLLFLLGGASAYRLFGLLFFLYPVLSYFLASPLTDSAEEPVKALSAGERSLLIRHAARQWSFFADLVSSSTRFLPPDNVQFAPREDTALRTSPTNIGLYLLSALAAMDLGFCDPHEGADRIERTLATVEGLPKHRGNLYNWYDLNDLSVLGNGFVSFVDSGNFVVSLIALAGGLAEYRDADERFAALERQCRRLADEADLSVFFNRRKKLFSVGVNASTGEAEQSCYDLLMSEARTASYYAVAAGLVPASHWKSLSRAAASRKGYIGMMSWSGTMFEYLMPQLFLPSYRNSFLLETFLFALSAQRRAGKAGVWGISESGYYSFDGDLHYRYRAHGVRELALCGDPGDETVFSPYSVYLALSVSPKSALKELSFLEKRGLFGRYGLCEALDLTPGKGVRSPDGTEGEAVVRSYMAHHVGMSLVSIANALYDRVFVRRFFRDGRMSAAACLLQEKLPARPDRVLDVRSTLPGSRRGKSSLPQTRTETARSDFASPKAALLQRGNLTLRVSSLGHVLLTRGEEQIFDCVFDRFSFSRTLTVGFIDGNGALHGCSPFFGEGAYSFEASPDGVTLISESAGFSGRTRFSFSRLTDCLRVETAAESRRTRQILFAFAPVLSDRASHDAHRSFSRLFIGSEYDEKERILYFFRRDRQSGKPKSWLAAALRDGDAAFAFTTDAGCLPPERADDPGELLCEPDGRTGICTEPFCLLRTSPLPGGKCCLLLSAADTREEARVSILTARHDRNRAQTRLPEGTNALLSDVLFPRYAFVGASARSYRRETLWQFGVSGDFPLLALPFRDGDPLPEAALASWKALTGAGVRTELLLLPEGDGQYLRPAEKRLLSLLGSFGLEEYLGRRGGVFLLREERLPPGFRELLPGISVPAERRSARQKAEPVPRVVRPIRSPSAGSVALPERSLRVYGGAAGAAGFTADKTVKAFSPWSFPLPGRLCGSIVTTNSLGYTFCGNAHERRLTPFPGDPGSLADGEVLYLRRGETLYDLAACAYKAFFGPGTAVWTGKAGDVSYTVTAFCSPDKPVKLVRVKLSAPAEVVFAVRPALGSGAFPNPVLQVEEQNGGLLFRSGHDPAFPDGLGFLRCEGASPIFSRGVLFAGTDDGFRDLAALRKTGADMTFLLGGTGEEDAEAVARSLRDLSYEKERSAAEAFALSMIPPIAVSTRSQALDLFFSRCLPYQVAASRFYCRASFRQSGGAFGFRDQLQDCLALVWADPAAVRAHLLLCCSRQYEEGDVQHWWHPGGRGVRTTCSDDLLWLPFVLSDYLEKTGDRMILREQVSYLSSPPLENETERYELPAKSFLSEPVLLHCLRVFDRADRRGKHGLLLMGSCDWNDAFSGVGARGKGESVFSTFLYIVAANAFLPHLQKEDPGAAERISGKAKELLEAAETHAFAGDRWIRAFCDDGETLGVAGRSECAIDILTQAFALFAGADRKKCVRGLAAAEKLLYDPKNRLLALFAPPFDKGNTPAGYIRGYPPGVRENGGQYTHAAVWGGLALLKIGRIDTALDLLCGMNPFIRTATRAGSERYRSEPYALCADIYTGALAGQGGWSWYTGSAAWLYKVLLEEVFGFRMFFRDGVRLLAFAPLVPCTLTVRFRGQGQEAKASVLTLRGKKPDQTPGPGSDCAPGFAPFEARLDGAPVSFPIRLPLPPGSRELTVPVPVRE